jgi:hypothetical protein
MPNKKYALDEDGPLDLEVAWSGQLKNFTVRYRGADVASVPALKEHKQGISFPLPNGRTLFAHWKTGGMAPELLLLVDGKPLPGSASDPLMRVKTAAGVTWFIAAMNTVLGVVAVAVKSEALDAIGIGLPSIFFGAVFATLGFFIWKKHSPAALYVAIALFALDSVASIAMAGGAMGSGGTPPIGGIIMRVFFFLALFRAVPAVKELAQKKAKLDVGGAGSSSGAPSTIPLETKRDPQL